MVLERYTERARRVFFFGKFEANKAGADFVCPHHLLLALIREWGNILFEIGETIHNDNRKSLLDAVNIAFPRVVGEKKEMNADDPIGNLSNDSEALFPLIQQVFETSASTDIGPEHLLWALASQEGLVAEILSKHGLTPEAVSAKFLNHKN